MGVFFHHLFEFSLRLSLRHLVTKEVMPKTVVDISAFDPFYIPDLSDEKIEEIDPDTLQDPREFQIETDELS